LFAALGDVTRLTLVERLSATPGEQSISRLGADLPMTRQAIRKHLTVLEEAGLVGARPSGREMLYALRREPIDRARACLDEIAGQWDTLLGRLKAQVEQDQ
jgi:DNA-binding transcriptional ArsR family regulator